MAGFYLNVLIDGLAEFDNHQHSYRFYRSLAYHRLKGTVTWNKLDKNRQQEADIDFNKLLNNGDYSCSQ